MKKAISLLLVVLTISTLILPCSAVEFEKGYKVGDTITFGSYPQTLVTDQDLIKELNSLEISWIAYEYYFGSEWYKTDWDYSTARQEDYMFYADVVYEGSEYRAVKIDGYRPFSAERVPVHDDDWAYLTQTYQPCNGYYKGNIYWFKYEPLVWYILNPEEGLIMSKKVLDCQPFNNILYYKENLEWHSYRYFLDAEFTTPASIWESSNIRKWLNNDFYNTTFSEIEKQEISKTNIISNTYYEVYEEDLKIIDSKETYDNVFLLSVKAVYNNSLGFTTLPDNRSVSSEIIEYTATDYAKAQGLSENSDCCDVGIGDVLLRDGAYRPGVVSVSGICSDTGCNHLVGIRPMIKLKNTFKNSCKCLCHSNNAFLKMIFKMFVKLFKFFNINYECKGCMAFHWHK